MLLLRTFATAQLYIRCLLSRLGIYCAAVFSLYKLVAVALQFPVQCLVMRIIRHHLTIAQDGHLFYEISAALSPAPPA